MPGKYLRFLQIEFAQGNRWVSSRPDPELMRAVYRVPRPCLPWMCEHLALPLPTQGIVKVVVHLTESDTNPEIEIVPHTPEDRTGQGIAYVYQHFDSAHFEKLTETEQNAYLLEQFHAALVRCAVACGWDPKQFEDARQQIVQANFQVTTSWTKPIASPDRQTKVQGFAEIGHEARFSVACFDAKKREIRRVLFSIGAPSLIAGPGNSSSFSIVWIDSDSFRIRIKGSDCYWNCSLAGTSEFVAPRAAAGDPHAEYQLGRMYLEGTTVLQDQATGWGWIRSAASKGYVHARRLLERRAPEP